MDLTKSRLEHSSLVPGKSEVVDEAEGALETSAQDVQQQLQELSINSEGREDAESSIGQPTPEGRPTLPDTQHFGETPSPGGQIQELILNDLRNQKHNFTSGWQIDVPDNERAGIIFNL